MENMRPFKVLEEYLSATDTGYTQADIAEALNVSLDTVKKWSTNKFTTKKITAYNIVKIWFTDKNTIDGFVNRLDLLGYDVSYFYPDKDKRNLSEDRFEGFLREFLAGNIKQKTNTEIDISGFETPENYFSQTLYLYNDETSTNKSIFDLDVCDFEKIKVNNRILISGPGGQGKSLFLKKISEKAKKSRAFKYTFYIELAELLSLSKEELMPFKKTAAPHILAYICSITKNFSDVAACLIGDDKKTPTILLLLDGLNELLALATNINQLQDIIDEIEYIGENWNTTIIITTRPSETENWFEQNYFLCSISGTPEKEFDQFLSENTGMNEKIKLLAKIPLFYNALVDLKKKNIKTKYDLLFNMLFTKYKKTNKRDFEGFVAYFVFAPLLIKELADKNVYSIRKTEVESFARNKFSEMQLDSFINFAQKECKVPIRKNNIDIDRIVAAFLNNGPVELSSTLNEENVYKIHDELRDFLHAFYYVGALSVSRDAVDAEDFSCIRDFDFKINLNDNACELFKEKLGLDSGADIKKLEENYTVLNTCELTPQAVLYAYTLFMISDNLNFGVAAVTPAHNILIRFTNRICNLITQNNFENHCLKNSSEKISPEQKNRIKNSMLDIFSKHCEYYRRHYKYSEEFKLLEIAEMLDSNSSVIIHQKSKLLIQMYQTFIKESKTFDIQSIGFSDYSELYTAGKKLLEKGADNNYSLSINLLAFIYSVPAPYLFDDPRITIEYDFVKAFHMYRSTIFSDRHPNFVVKRIAYTIRQITGLILKGYVKFNPDFEAYEDGNPGDNSVVAGNRNILDLDPSSVKMAKYFLKIADGVSTVNTLNYFRGIVAWYEKDDVAAKKFFDAEKDILLKSIFQHYVYDYDVDLDSLYDGIRNMLYDDKLNAIDKCHPIYAYCDAKIMEMTFNGKNRKPFFDKFEEDLPESWKKIVQQLTQ